MERLAFGAIGGLVGTVALFGLRTAQQKLLPEIKMPEREDPGKFMVEAAESAALDEKTQRQVPDIAEKAAANSLHFSYGTSGGVLYALLRPEAGNAFLEGAALGLSVWAVGYLGWLPAAGITPPVTEQSPEQNASSILQHLLYGTITVAAYREMQNLAS